MNGTIHADSKTRDLKALKFDNSQLVENMDIKKMGTDT